jgi:tight adherence protein B
MRDRFKLRRQIRVVSAHGRISAFVLCALPPVLAVLMFMISPHLMSVLTTDPVGVRLVLIALVLQVVGTVMIARMVKIEY